MKPSDSLAGGQALFSLWTSRFASATVLAALALIAAPAAKADVVETFYLSGNFGSFFGPPVPFTGAINLDFSNDFAEETTYRLSGKVELDGQPGFSIATMLASSEAPAPAPIQLAGWWGDKFNRLFLNPVHMPKLKSVDATIDILPERRVATIENAWIPSSEVDAGSEVPVRVFLRPYRGERLERDFTLKIPPGLAKGEHRILLSDADTLNRMQSLAGMADRFMDIPQTVSLINQERSNNKLYISLVEPRPTVFYEDKTLPSLPASIVNVMQTGRTASKHLVSSAESAVEQGSIPFDLMIDGSYSLRVTVK